MDLAYQEREGGQGLLVLRGYPHEALWGFLVSTGDRGALSSQGARPHRRIPGREVVGPQCRGSGSFAVPSRHPGRYRGGALSRSDRRTPGRGKRAFPRAELGAAQSGPAAHRSLSRAHCPVKTASTSGLHRFTPTLNREEKRRPSGGDSARRVAYRYGDLNPGLRTAVRRDRSRRLAFLHSMGR